MNAVNNRPYNLKCEQSRNPLGIETKKPRLSWELPANIKTQTAYQVQVASSPERLEQEKADLWDSGLCENSESHLIPYAGKTLRSRMTCWWHVRVCDETGDLSAYSSPACWEMGLLDRKDWNPAQWIAMPDNPEWVSTLSTQREPSPLLRKSFVVKKTITHARIYICGLGFHELHLNGKKIGDHVLDPAFTAYDKRAFYVVHDVTDFLQAGANALGVMLGNSWFNMHTIENKRFAEAAWRDRPQLLLSLEMTFSDGSTEQVASDLSWKSSPGPILMDSVRNGETYDAQREQPGWNTTAFDDSAWRPVMKAKGPAGKLEFQHMPPCRITETIKPASVIRTGPEKFLADFGQTISGHTHLKLDAPEGTRVTLRHTELADETAPPKQRGTRPHVPNDVYVFSGEFQTDTYIARGGKTEEWEPRFTCHGFQHVQAEGLRRMADAKALRARRVHTGFERIGRFECSDPLLNRLQEMSERSFLFNFCGYPSDCPAREKAAWTGDGANPAVGALYTFDCASGYAKWLNDLRDTQREDGLLAAIAPTAGWGYQQQFTGPAWLSVYVALAWNLYCQRGDKRILQDFFDSMMRLSEYYEKHAKGTLIDFGLADWLAPRVEKPEGGSTTLLYSSAHWFQMLRLLAQMAGVLGKKDVKTKLNRKAVLVRGAINRKMYDTKTGCYAEGLQSDQACALFFDLPSANEKQKALTRLGETIRERNFHFDTGVIGTGMLLNTLSENGMADLAFRMATRRGYPGFAWWVDQGATALWERWDGTASHNHPCYCNISEWFYQTLAGIQPTANRPGFREIRIAPQPVGTLKWVRAEHHSPYGLVRSEWERKGRQFTLTTTVPPNTTATVYLPNREIHHVESGTHSFRVSLFRKAAEMHPAAACSR